MKASPCVTDAITKALAAEPEQRFTFADLAKAIYGKVTPFNVAAVRIAAAELAREYDTVEFEDTPS